MKKHPLTMWIVAIGILGIFSSAGAEVQSLRGYAGIENDSTAPDVKQYQKDEEPMARDYLQQPPLIPHKIDNYTVNIKHNKCLSCHSWKNYKRHNATKISQTHFESRGGAIQSTVSARRYFCAQCHVPQVNAKPLVENTFQPVESMKLN